MGRWDGPGEGRRMVKSKLKKIASVGKEGMQKDHIQGKKL